MNGLGVNIRALCGYGDTEKIVQENLDKTIESVELRDDALHFVMKNGKRWKLFDNGQSCCESRYMVIDDNLSEYAGARLRSIRVEDAPDVVTDDDWGGNHEVQFLKVMTSKGEFVAASHNEHNGYYGGFSIEAEWEDDQKP